MTVKTLTAPGRARVFAAIALAATLALPVAAQVPANAALQSLGDVQSAAERALRRQIGPHLAGVTLTAVGPDARLRLPACAAPLETYTQTPRGNQARGLVRVSCNTGAVWTLNVPVQIRRELDVLVLRRAVARGETLTASDVIAEKRVVNSLSSPYVSRVKDLANRTTRRPLPQGTPVTAEALSVALLIHRGQRVTLTATTAGFEVRAPGRALADAAASQRLRVQNLDSLKVVEGVAESAGVVRVTP